MLTRFNTLDGLCASAISVAATDGHVLGVGFNTLDGLCASAIS